MTEPVPLAGCEAPLSRGSGRVYCGSVTGRQARCISAETQAPSALPTYPPRFLGQGLAAPSPRCYGLAPANGACGREPASDHDLRSRAGGTYRCSGGINPRWRRRVRWCGRTTGDQLWVDTSGASRSVAPDHRGTHTPLLPLVQLGTYFAGRQDAIVYPAEAYVFYFYHFLKAQVGDLRELVRLIAQVKVI